MLYHFFNRQFIFLFIFCFPLQDVCGIEEKVKVAVVHFKPDHREVETNIKRLVHLAEEAGNNGAKIVVFPELATSGYSYFNRNQIREVAEEFPGETTKSLSWVAKKYGLYVVVGVPEYSSSTNLFYNSCVLIDPYGEIVGTSRKHSHLMESCWCASGNGHVPIFDTMYGKIAILICADLHFSDLAIQVFREDVLFLIAPTNAGVSTDLLKARAIEGRCHLLLANRYGNEKEAFSSIEKSEQFNEDTLMIIPPFAYDFQDGKSVIVDMQGQIQVMIEDPYDSIGYCELSLKDRPKETVVRRPDLYALLSQNTLTSYAMKCMHLPIAKPCMVAASRLGCVNKDEVVEELKESLTRICSCSCLGGLLKLVVFPANVTSFSRKELENYISVLKNLAKQFNIDFVVGFKIADGDKVYPLSCFFTNEGKCFFYKPVHKKCFENMELGDHFIVVDRDYGRVAFLQDRDMRLSESSRVLAKMGVDIIAVSSEETDDIIRTFCRVRSADYVHIVMANRLGKSGVYRGGFQTFPPFAEDDELVVMQINIEDVRDKKELNILLSEELLNSGFSKKQAA